MYSVKLQLICLIFVGILWCYNSKNKRLKTSYNFLYRMMLINLLINIIFDIITFFTVNNLNSVPVYINDIAHRIFIFTVDSFSFLLYIYMLSYVIGKKDLGKFRIAIAVTPIIISLIAILCGPIYYKKDIITNYCCGPVANTIYASVAFYIIVTFIQCIKYRKKVEEHVMNGILRALLAVTAGGIVQLLFPEMLISSGTQTIVVFILFLSFEDSALFIDKTTGIFNKYAFAKMIDDKIIFNENYFAVAAYADEDDEKRNNDTLIKFDKEMCTKFDTDIYLISASCFAIIAPDNKAVQFFLSKIKENIAREDIIICRASDGYSSGQEVVEKIEKFNNTVVERRTTFDKSTGVRNRNGYERRLNYLNVHKEETEKLWGIIVDVNNLKKTNDTYGHSMGDYLIKMTAKILTETLENHDIYRIGGDEFAVFLNNYNRELAEDIVNSIKTCQKKYNESSDTPINFSIGYSYFEHEKDDYVQDMIKRADHNMYINKRKSHESREQYGL